MLRLHERNASEFWMYSLQGSHTVTFSSWSRQQEIALFRTRPRQTIQFWPVSVLAFYNEMTTRPTKAHSGVKMRSELWSIPIWPWQTITCEAEQCVLSLHGWSFGICEKLSYGIESRDSRAAEALCLKSWKADKAFNQENCSWLWKEQIERAI